MGPKDKMKQINDYERRCGLYVRVSTIGQAEEGESLDEQEQRLKAFCEYKGWKNYNVYREEGRSAKDTNRPALQRLLSDIEKGLINTVIVKKIDRLSRSILDFEQMFKFFEERGVDLISLNENFDTSTAIGRSVIRIILVFAQLEREQTAERTIDIMRYRAKKGLWNGGYPPLGYDVKEGVLVPNTEEAEVVREIFETYINTGSLSETAKILNNKGYRTKKWTTKQGKIMGGNRFNKNNISRILKDPVYIGKIKYEGQIYDGVHPGIIDEEVFYYVQDMFSQNRSSNTGFRRGTEKFLLKGLVYCGHCGCAMAPSFAYSKGKKYYYYRCLVSNDRSRGKCPVGSINAKVLEDLIIKELQFLAESPDFVDEVVEEAIREERKEGERLRKKKQDLVKKLREVESNARKMMNLIEEIDKTDPRFAFILQRLKELGEEREGLQKEIESLEFKINEVENNYLNAESLKANFKYFKDVFEYLTPEEQYDLLHLLIKRIVYYGKEIRDREERAKIKLELWDIGPLASEEGFAERFIWLPGQDSNLQPTG